MKDKQRKATAILAAIMLAPAATYADVPAVSITEAQERINADVDNSNLQVEATTQIGDEKTTIFTGKLKDYDNGAWVNIDFSGIGFAIIFEWSETLSAPVYITPLRTAENQAAALPARRNSAGIINTADGLSLSSQIKINGVNVGEKGLRIINNAQMDCLFGLENSTANDRTISVILATYTSDGRLYTVKRVQLPTPAGQNGNARLIYHFDTENEYSARLMFWDSLAGMFPIKTAVNFDCESGINAYYYDTDNRLIQVDKANGKSVFYAYDNMGNLLSKTVGGAE